MNSSLRPTRRKLSRTVALAIGFVVFVVSPGRTAPVLPDKDADVDCGVPLWASTPAKPMILQIIGKSATDPTKRDTCIVMVNNLPQFTFNFPAFVPPAPLLGENIFQYRVRYNAAAQAYLAARQAAFKAAWEAASKDKADKIAAAINASPCGAGRATSSQVNNPAGYMQGRVTITNALKVTHGVKSNTTGEVGDGVKFKPGAGGTGGAGSYQGSMGSRSMSGLSATGVDPSGGPSVVEIGILGRYVASWYPLPAGVFPGYPGDGYDDVMLGLQSLLDTNGLPATYDTGTGLLSLNDIFTDGDEFYWSMSDLGFDENLGIVYGLTDELPVRTLRTTWGGVKGVYR